MYGAIVGSHCGRRAPWRSGGGGGGGGGGMAEAPRPRLVLQVPRWHIGRGGGAGDFIASPTLGITNKWEAWSKRDITRNLTLAVPDLPQ